MDLSGKTVLITGAAVRIGRELALAAARHGADIMLHYGHSEEEALSAREEIQSIGREVHLLQADLNDVGQTIGLVEHASQLSPVHALINNASIFEPLNWNQTTNDAWQRHMQINLTAPFLLSQAFARQLPEGENGRIVNLLDWRALRPGADHLPYTISKAGLYALTQSLAAALAPQITVNGLALGAILPPSDGGESDDILQYVPAGRWADVDEISQAALFLLGGPAYITGEIIYVDGGRHLI